MSTTETSIAAYQANGKITAVAGNTVTFCPPGTTYELHLATKAPYTGPQKTPISGTIRVTARRMWTVPSGGNFITPIQGPPKCIQGRVKLVTEKEIVVHAAVPFVITLPSEASAIDMNRGPIVEGAVVNIVCFPGATLETSA